jgi:hypothetical protein
MLSETQDILRRLAAADREHQKEKGGGFFLRSLKYVFALVLGAFIVDVAFQLGSGWRLALLLGGIAVFLGLAGIAWGLAYRRRNRLEHIARFLEEREPTLGSRLINVLQLQEQTRDTSLSPLTRELAAQAVADYGHELRGFALERLAWTGDLRRHLKRALWAALGFTSILALGFRVSVIEMARFGDPFGDHPPYSFTQLSIVDPRPAGTNVVYGQGLLVKVKATGHQPKEVFLTSFPPGHPEQSTTVPMFDKGSAGYDQLVPNVRSELVLVAHTKSRSSFSRQVRIGVVLTPKLEKSFVQITPPAYTGLKPEEKAYSFKAVQALQGSEVRFRLQSNRPLRGGLLELTSGDQPPQRLAMTNSAENEVACSFRAEESSRLRFSLVDVAGLPSQEDWQGALTVTHDLPPEIRITEPERDVLVALDFMLKAHLEASDDYGLRTIRIHRAINGVYLAPKIVSYAGIVRDSHETVDFNLAELGVQPGDTLSLFAEAVDTAPEPHLSRSQVVKLQVISVEDYNNFLRERSDIADAEAKYSALMEDLQALVEDQKKLGEAAQSLEREMAKPKPPRDQVSLQLDDLLARQNELNEKLNKQAQRMETFVRENPLYDVEKELQEALREEAQKIRASTGSNQATTRDIAQRSSPPNSPRQLAPALASDFKKASDEQVARLGGVQEQTEKDVTALLQDMGLMQDLLKDFNQFEALYQVQQELAAQAQAYDRAGMLNREDQLALKELASTEKQVAELLNEVEENLRQHARAAEKLFPKAAKSGQDLATAMAELRLQPLARQATGQMLAGNGERSARLAGRLRQEMEKLFSQCQGGNCPSGSELDAYLRLQRSMKAGNSFAQMARSRKFGRPGASGMGGSGEGQSGMSGYAVMNGQTVDVMGNENLNSRGSASGRQPPRLGQGALAAKGKSERPEIDKSDRLKGLNPVNRQSGAVASESVADEYSALVDHYFKAITAKKKP